MAWTRLRPLAVQQQLGFYFRAEKATALLMPLALEPPIRAQILGDTVGEMSGAQQFRDGEGPGETALRRPPSGHRVPITQNRPTPAALLAFDPLPLRVRRQLDRGDD